MSTKNLVIFLAVCIFLSSCSLDEKMNTQNKQDVYIELNENLATYNTIFWDANSVPQTRGFWNNFKKRLRGFLIADTGGAIIGSTFGGMGAIFGAVFGSAFGGPAIAEQITINQDSNSATCPSTSISSDSTQVVSSTDPYSAQVLSDDYEIADPPSNHTTVNCYATVTFSGIGYQHNLILSEIAVAHPNIYNEMKSSEEMSDLIVKEMNKSNQNIPEAEKNILIQKINSIILEYKTDSTTDIITLLKNAYPEYSNEFSIVDDFTINIMDLTDNIELMKSYLEGYLQVIESSNLTSSQKEVLKSSLEVAANSAVFWVTE